MSNTHPLNPVTGFPAGCSFANYAGAATNAVSAVAATLVAIIVNKAVATGVITVYDNTAASGTKVATITHPATLLHSQMVLPYNVYCATGITVVTSAADDITVVYY